MNNILHHKTTRYRIIILTITIALFGTSVFYSAPTSAVTVYCTNCGNWRTQLLEKAAAVKTQINTANQLLDAIEQAKSLPNQMSLDITHDLQQIINIYNNSRLIGKDVENIEKEFRMQYKGYAHYLESTGQASLVMPERYEQWASSGLDNVRVALEAASINVSSFDNESDMLDRMLSRSGTAVGRLQAIQAGNEIAILNVQQLQKLRDMIQTQLIMQANYMALEIERQAVDDANREIFRSVRPINTGNYKEF